MNESLRSQLPQLISFAARHLHWPPECFWLSTPDDLMLALTPPDNQPGSLTRDELDCMMKDEPHG